VLHAALVTDPGRDAPPRGVERALASWQRTTATFLDDGRVVAAREVELLVTDDGAHRRVAGRLLGGNRAAKDLAGRRLRFVASLLGDEPLLCVVRTQGEVHFLEHGGEPSGDREPRRPRAPRPGRGGHSASK
jgi:hypothetical protein